MAIDKITTQIMDDAEADCAVLRSKTEKKANSAERDIVSRAERRAEKMRQNARETVALRTERAIQSAELENRKYSLAQKQALLATCYQELGEKLRQMNKAQWQEYFAPIIIDACSTGDETVRYCAADKDKVDFAFQMQIATELQKRNIKNHLHFEETLSDREGGLLIDSQHYEVDARMDSVLETIAERTMIDATEKLFVEEA